MKLSKFVAYSVATLAGIGLLVAGGLGVGSVVAASEDGEYPLIIQNLAEKFNLNPEEVQQVFEDTRKEKEEARLDEAVSEGIITEEQKTMILEKREQVKAQIEEINNKQLTAQERREQIKEVLDEVRTWAEENDIPLYLLKPGHRGPKRMGPRGGFGRGEGMMGQEMPDDGDGTGMMEGETGPAEEI